MWLLIWASANVGTVSVTGNHPPRPALGPNTILFYQIRICTQSYHLLAWHFITPRYNRLSAMVCMYCKQLQSIWFDLKEDEWWIDSWCFSSPYWSSLHSCVDRRGQSMVQDSSGASHFLHWHRWARSQSRFLATVFLFHSLCLVTLLSSEQCSQFERFCLQHDQMVNKMSSFKTKLINNWGEVSSPFDVSLCHVLDSRYALTNCCNANFGQMSWPLPSIELCE